MPRSRFLVGSVVVACSGVAAMAVCVCGGREGGWVVLVHRSCVVVVSAPTECTKTQKLRHIEAFLARACAAAFLGMPCTEALWR